MPLDEYVGRQLWEVRRYLNNLPDAGYFIHPSLQIRNDRFIETEPNPYLGRVLPANPNGWIGKEHGIGDWYIIQPGDETMYTRTQYFHSDCHKDWVTKKTRMEFEQLFANAGMYVSKMDPARNEYGSFTYRGPWFNVQTPGGDIRIGWRKRVIEIVLKGDWPVNCSELFSGEHVTTGQSLVHARSLEKASQYLKAISHAVSQ